MIRRRSVALALVSMFAVSLAGLGANGATPAPPLKQYQTIAQMASEYADAFTLAPPPQGQTPEQRAQWLLEQRPALGRTPMDWIRWTNEAFSLDAPAEARAEHADLVEGIARLYAALDLPMTDALRATLEADAAAIPAGLRGPFADAVDAVADATLEQIPVAARVRARVLDGFEPTELLLTIAERDAMIANAARIMRAVNAVNVALGAHRADLAEPTPAPKAGGSDAPLFSDPEGLVILGGLGNATYARDGVIEDPVLLIEPDGSDLYLNSAGGACPFWEPMFIGDWMKCNLLAVSVVADLGADSNDIYRYAGPPAAVQGAGGIGGLGLLVDAGGDDVYDAKMTRSGIGPWMQYFDGGAQGFGYSGVGVQVDVAGDDVYDFEVTSGTPLVAGPPIWALGQGFGGGGGFGLSHDVQGKDDWLTYATGRTYSFNGIYTDGVGFYGGLGIMNDTGLGDDIYDARVTATSVDYYAQGFGAFGGAGIMYEDGGNDSYFTYEEATGSVLAISPVLNCAYGTASFGAIGIMVDVLGDDVYIGKSKSTQGATVMDNGFGGPGVAYGLFTDTGGDDRYEMYATTGSPGDFKKIAGRGLYQVGVFENPDFISEPAGTNSWGTFVDIGGTDVYIPSTIGGNNSQWPFGVDRSA